MHEDVDDAELDLATELEKLGRLIGTGKKSQSGYCTYKKYKVRPKFVFL